MYALRQGYVRKDNAFLFARFVYFGLLSREIRLFTIVHEDIIEIYIIRYYLHNETNKVKSVRF